MIAKFKKSLQRKSSDFQHNEKKLIEEEKAFKQVASEYENICTAQKITQQVAESVQENAHKQISAVVSKCLETVFDEPYEFQIKFDQKRGKTEARLVFVRDGNEIDPTTAAGGGVIDIAAFALRLACLILSQPRRRKLMILDEPFRFVSAGHRERVREMIETLSRDLEMQFIQVTHIQELVLGNVIEL